MMVLLKNKILLLGFGAVIIVLAGGGYILWQKNIKTVSDTSASAITSPPPSMVGINTHTELYGTGADPDIITLGPKVGGHTGWEPYQYKPGMSFEAYKDGSPVLAPFDMMLVGFRDTSTQIVSKGTSAHSDDVKLFFKSASP